MSNFGLFLTFGLSISNWEKIGSLSREIKPYIELAKSFDNIYIFSYGIGEQKKFSSLLPENIKIICRPDFVPSIVYSVLLPIIHFKILKKIQIIKTNQMSGSWVAVVVKKIYNNKLIVRCGYEWLQYLERVKTPCLKLKIASLIEKFAYNNADKIIITSGEGRDFIKHRFSVSESKIILNPNYVDIDRFKPLEIEKKSGRIVFVGRLDPVKNLENLIRAMSGLDASLVVIGEGALRGDLEDLAKENGVRIEFKGTLSQDKLPIELNMSEIFVLPSISEGNPKVLLEAMSCGLACLGSDIASIREIIKDGENGVLCQTDSKSIHNTLSKLLEDPELRRLVGLSARQTILNRFSFEKIIDKELILYEQILR